MHLSASILEQAKLRFKVNEMSSFSSGFQEHVQLDGASSHAHGGTSLQVQTVRLRVRSIQQTDQAHEDPWAQRQRGVPL